MFAEGDVANAQPQPRMDIPKLIEYYVSQGYNSVDIKEMLPQVSFQEIESLVGALGGSLNPAIASPGANEFTGDINPFLQIPETATIANAEGMTTINPSFPVGAASPELPSEDDISLIPEDIRRYIQAASKVLDDEGLVQGLKISFDLSEEEARNMIGMSLKPSTDIDMIDPSRPSPQDLLTIDDGLPEISGIGQSQSVGNSSLGNNEFIANGQSFIIDDEFRNNLKNGNVTARSLFQIVRAEDFDAGPDAMKEILTFVQQNNPGIFSGLTPNPEGLSEEERLGSYISPESFGTVADDVLRSGRNFLFDATEGLASIVGGGIGGPRVRQKIKDAYEGTEYTQSEVIDDNLAVLQESYGLKSIDKSLEDIAKEEANPEVFTFKEDQFKDGELDKKVSQTDVDAQKETPTTDDDATGTSTDPVTTGADPDTKAEKEEDDIPGITPSTPNDEAEQLLTVFDKVGGFINSDANLRMMRNVGKGLTQYGNFAEGIGIGAAAASEERQLQEQVDAKRDAELAAEIIKKGGPRDNALIKTIRDAKVNIGNNYREFQESDSTIRLTNSVLQFINDGDITSLASRLNVGKDRLLTLAGLGPEDITDQSPRGRAQNALTILKQKNIKAILNESSRTISNIDRDIADRIAGSLEDFDLTTPGALKQKLEETLRSATETKRAARISAGAEADLLRETGDYNALESALKDFLQKEVSGEYTPTGTSSTTGSISSKDPNDIQLDITGE
jgi:hypothetical protein